MDLEEHERQLLQQLVEEMTTLLEADIPRADPVVARLFPDAYEEPDDARAFHELVGSELRNAKAAALAEVTRAVAGSGPLELRLSSEQAEAWLRWLTDVRLAIGTRLDVTEEDMGAEIDLRSDDAAAMSVLHWLGWMQESLLEQMPIR